MLTYEQKKGLAAFIQDPKTGKKTEVDLNSISDEKFQELQRYVEECLRDNKTRQPQEFPPPSRKRPPEEAYPPQYD